MARKAIPKKVRELVYQKYGGHCAYCGCKLEYKDMQVDHVVSVYRNDWRRLFSEPNLSDEELNSLENYMPACRQCNFYKGTFELETFRDNLSHMMVDNLKKNFNYRLAVKYGLIKENFKPVKFYFETFDDQLPGQMNIEDII